MAQRSPRSFIWRRWCTRTRRGGLAPPWVVPPPSAAVPGPCPYGAGSSLTGPSSPPRGAASCSFWTSGQVGRPPGERVGSHSGAGISRVGLVLPPPAGDRQPAVPAEGERGDLGAGGGLAALPLRPVDHADHAVDDPGVEV